MEDWFYEISTPQMLHKFRPQPRFYRTKFCCITNILTLFVFVYFILTHFRTVPAPNRSYDNHFIMMFHWNITLQTHSYNILPNHIVLATGQPVFVLKFITSIRQGIYSFEMFGLTMPVIESEASSRWKKTPASAH